MASGSGERDVLPFCVFPKNVLFKRDCSNWIKKDEETKERLKKMEKDISEMKKEITELRMMVSSPSSTEDDFFVLEEASEEASPEEAPPNEN